MTRRTKTKTDPPAKPRSTSARWEEAFAAIESQQPKLVPGSKGLGPRLRWARASARMSAAELGAKVGLTKATIHFCEVGEGPTPRIATAEEMAKVLGVSPGWLLLGIGAPGDVQTGTDE